MWFIRSKEPQKIDTGRNRAPFSANNDEDFFGKRATPPYGYLLSCILNFFPLIYLSIKRIRPWIIQSSQWRSSLNDDRHVESSSRSRRWQPIQLGRKRFKRNALKDSILLLAKPTRVIRRVLLACSRRRVRRPQQRRRFHKEITVRPHRHDTLNYLLQERRHAQNKPAEQRQRHRSRLGFLPQKPS